MKTARRRSAAALADRLARVKALREQETGPALLDALREALRDPSGHVVARAAELTGERELAELENDLAAAAERLLREPAERDRSCLGKSAVVEALVRIGSDATATYLAAASHVQQEPVFGGRVDVAGGLRGAAVMGLVRSAHPRAYEILAERLADPEVQAQVGAAEAASHGAPHVVSPLLRLRALAGDPEPRVLGACFAALLDVEGDGALGFVQRFLEGAPAEVQEAAALALGESRLEAAFPLLCAFREGADSRNADRVAFIALSMLRSDAAQAYLAAVVRSAPPGVARQALAVLLPLPERPAWRQQVVDAVRARKDRSLDAALEEALAGPRA